MDITIRHADEGRRLVTIEYLAPVAVTVDLDRGRVTRVVVVDEEVEPTVKVGERVIGAGIGTGATEEESDLAYTIASEADWPAWQVGG